MSADEMLQRVASTVGDSIGVEVKELDMDADLKLLELDELAEVEIIIELENLMGVKIPHEDFIRVSNIRGLADYLYSRMKKD